MAVTPCIKICKQNSQGFCLGCKRHISEISSWRSYSPAMREAVMDDLKERRLETLQQQ